MGKIVNHRGFVKIENFLDLNLFNELVSFSNKKLILLASNKFKNKEIWYLNQIIEDKKFQFLTEKYSGIKFSELRKRMTTNINVKIPSLSTFTNLHYDKCHLNWVIPLRIDNKKNADLIIFPNSRKKPFLFFSLKFLMVILTSRFLLNSRKLIGLLGGRYVKYKPNHAYIFDGYKSIHGVPWTKNDGVRSVITINFSL